MQFLQLIVSNHFDIPDIVDNLNINNRRPNNSAAIENLLNVRIYFYEFSADICKLVSHKLIKLNSPVECAQSKVVGTPEECRTHTP